MCSLRKEYGADNWMHPHASDNNDGTETCSEWDPFGPHKSRDRANQGAGKKREKSSWTQ